MPQGLEPISEMGEVNLRSQAASLAGSTSGQRCEPTSEVDLTDEQWNFIQPLLPERKPKRED